MTPRPLTHRSLIALGGAAILIVAILAVLRLPAISSETPRAEVVRDDTVVAVFALELAVTREQQIRGLMGREHLAPNTGMLFVFDRPGRYGMWMANMLISLDFLFIDADGKVVYVAENIPPCPPGGPCPSIMAPVPVLYVLEIPAGSIEEYGIQAGDVIRFHPDDL